MASAVVHDMDYLMQRSIPEPNTGCWIWTGATRPDGYGVISRAPWTPHAVAAKLKFGDRPDGMECDHACNNRSCVNPDHIRYMTHADNVRRYDHRITSANAKKTHCKRGHALDGANLIIEVDKITGSTVRKCRACKAARYSASAKRAKTHRS